MDFHTPTRDHSRPPLPNLPATPESQILSSPITLFSSPNSHILRTPVTNLWPQQTNTVTFVPQIGENFAVGENLSTTPGGNGQDSGRRGRPRADHISNLINSGINSPNGIKCRVCNRVFPREKSLQVRNHAIIALFFDRIHTMAFFMCSMLTDLLTYFCNIENFSIR